ncbi:endochitinase A [Cocos nucifera]|nr:endochitinase A [Cocos nucifera]
MNRSFRAPEAPQPQATMTTRGRTLGAVMKDRDEDLALFLEMRKREKERNDLLLHHSEELDPLTGSKPGSAPIFKIVPSAPARKAGVDDFLNSDSDKNDYDWLLTPPGTPLFPSLDKESNRSPGGNTGATKAHPAVLKSRLAKPSETSSRSSLPSRQAASSTGLNSSALEARRPSSSGGPIRMSSRPATPAGCPTLTATSKSSRPSTPTSRATLSSKSVVPPPRSSTPARSSTPTSRPASRSATPTRRPSMPSSLPASSAPPGRSSSVTKSGFTTSKSSAPSHGSSPSVKSRPWKPSDMPGFSLDAPPNLRTSLPDRPSSASRGRPGAPSSRSSIEAGPSVRPRQQSCSPSRGRAPNGIVHKGGSVPAVSRSHLNGGDSINPVLIGNKMVERVVNMRRLAPPKQDDQRSVNSLPGKPSLSPDSTGFGRTISKKSLDMALRHMDIRRSIPNGLRPLMTKVPESSMYSLRSGPTRSRLVSVSDSPLASSSNASSEQSINNNMICLDGSELEDDLSSEKGLSR